MVSPSQERVVTEMHVVTSYNSQHCILLLWQPPKNKDLPVPGVLPSSCETVPKAPELLLLISRFFPSPPSFPFPSPPSLLSSLLPLSSPSPPPVLLLLLPLSSSLLGRVGVEAECFHIVQPDLKCSLVSQPFKC